MPVPTTLASLNAVPSSNSPPGSESVGTQANEYLQAAFAFIAQLYQGGLLPIAAVNMNGQKLTGLAAGVAGTDAATITQNNTVLGAPSGTRMIFQQAAIPLGWTVDGNPALNDCSMRMVAGGAGGIAGTTPWSSWNFGGAFATSAVGLSIAQMPSHTHGDFGHTHGFADPGHVHGVGDPGHAHTTNVAVAVQGSTFSQEGTNSRLFNIGVVGTTTVATGVFLGVSGTNASIQAGAANLQAQGSGAAHSHTFNSPQVKYCDNQVGVKS